MRTVWKRILPIEIEVTIMWPRGSRVTAVAAQDDDLCVWFACDTDADMVMKMFHITGTGHQAPEGMSGPWTVPMPNGMVWHVWESAER